MKRISPPKHRHDGASPLPLGMDWSPPPKKWDGRNTVWPHDPHTGWSYCVMVPSWVVQTETKASSDSLLNPIVFYRIQVGIQSPEGVSSIQGVLRRFSDFLKLHSALKRAFPKKDIPPAPPKHALLRINSSRLLLEERRRALEEWMGKLLSDIDLSRSASVAAFLDLEVAARSSFQDTSQLSLDTGHQGEASHPERSSSALAGSSAFPSKSHSVTSDIGSDNAYEVLGLGTSSQEISNGTFLGESVIGRESFSGISLKDRLELIPQPDLDILSGHSRKHSADSIGSDASSLRGSEISIPGISNSMWDGSGDMTGVDPQCFMESLSGMEAQFLNDAQILLPFDQQNKLNRVLVTMQRRLVTAKTDVEDLIARLNQEMAVKEYLTTKVKDLEGELEITKQKGKENLQQALLVERERVTQMQWDMDELRRKYTEMESKLSVQQCETTRAESEKFNASSEKELLLQELDGKQEHIDKLQRHLLDVEKKSKADIKVLIKEVKFLRSSQAELKELFNQSIKEKTELETVLQNEKQRWAYSKSARKELLHECKILCQRLQECSVNFVAEEDSFTVSPSSLSDVLGDLETSDNRIGFLIAEAQLLAQDDEHPFPGEEKTKITDASENLITMNGDDPIKADNEMRRVLTDMLIDNARLRKQANSIIRDSFKTAIVPTEEGDPGDPGPEATSRKSVLNRFLSLCTASLCIGSSVYAQPHSTVMSRRVYAQPVRPLKSEQMAVNIDVVFHDVPLENEEEDNLILLQVNAKSNKVEKKTAIEQRKNTYMLSNLDMYMQPHEWYYF